MTLTNVNSSGKASIIMSEALPKYYLAQRYAAMNNLGYLIKIDNQK